MAKTCILFTSLLEKTIETCPKDNRKCNGFNGYNGNCIGFSGNYNGVLLVCRDGYRNPVFNRSRG